MSTKSEIKEFLDAKEIAIKKLNQACKKELVDKEIIDLLNIINNSEKYYTTSSCAGRIVLLEIPSIGDKKNARFLGRWHNTITKKDVATSLEKTQKGLLWILAQSPIIHIGCDAIEAADEIIKIAVSCGFKNSGIKQTEKKYIIEICSTERIDAPIGNNGILFCKDEYLIMLIDISNEVLNRSRKKLLKFTETLKKKL